jgi:Zn-finger nucleic acid-binding protein
MKCPRDSATLEVRDVEGHIGYLCHSCKGAWLPSKYVRSIEHLRKFSYAEFLATLSASARIVETLGCPSGCGYLEQVSGPQFALSWCTTCQGVWFDRGEIARLLTRHESREKPYPQMIAEQTAWGVLADAVVLLLP